MCLKYVALFQQKYNGVSSFSYWFGLPNGAGNIALFLFMPQPIPFRCLIFQQFCRGVVEKYADRI